jgi:hypothetical protein
MTVEIVGLGAIQHLDLRSCRHLEDKRLSISAVTVTTSAWMTGLGFIDPSMTKVSQRRHTFIRLEDNVAAVATITTVRPTAGYILLATEAD